MDTLIADSIFLVVIRLVFELDLTSRFEFASLDVWVGLIKFHVNGDKLVRLIDLILA